MRNHGVSLLIQQREIEMGSLAEQTAVDTKRKDRRPCLHTERVQEWLCVCICLYVCVGVFSLVWFGVVSLCVSKDICVQWEGSLFLMWKWFVFIM